MKNKRSTRLLAQTLILILTAWCTTNTFGSITLTNVPLYGTDTSNEGRAITYDGQYIVGLSGTSLGFFYNVASNIIANPIGGGAQATIVTGVGYRTNLTNQLEVILSGLTTSGYGNWMTMDGGLTWGAKRRDTNLGTAPWKIPAANGLAGTASDIFYSTFYDSSSSVNWRVGQFSNAWPMTPIWGNKSISSGQGGVATGISSTGRAIGYRRAASGGPLMNYMLDWIGATTPTPTFFAGLDGSQKGQPFSVSADGATIFGMSPTVADQTNNYAYKALFSGTTETGMNPLPEFSDTGGSTSRGIPYGCTVDGRYASGMNYRGRETAVVWDTTSTDPTTWTISDLYGLAAANGVADIFLSLRRAYSIGTNTAGDLAITGTGFDGANTRAFLMTLPRWIAAIGFPGHQTVVFGSNVTFRVVTNGTDALSYQWYKNGSELAGQTGASVSFTGVTCAGGQAGDYQVVVSNAAISAVVTGYVATLTVLDPYISAQPVSQNALIGTNVTFTVTASGSAPLAYKWQRGGIDLTDGDTGWGSTIAGATTATLTITNVQLGDANTYNVVVTTGGGCPASSSVRNLNVYARPMLLGITTDFLGNYTLTLDCTNVQPYRIFYSTNVASPLLSWTPLQTNTFTGVSVTYTDANRTNTQGYYIISSP